MAVIAAATAAAAATSFPRGGRKSKASLDTTTASTAVASPGDALFGKRGLATTSTEEQPLKKKGPGQGLHQSDAICSTVGWLCEASQTLEYGKNYDGYWNGELFVKQVSYFYFVSNKIC